MRLLVDAQLPLRPPILMLVATGNMGNAELEALFARNLSAIEAALGESDFVEMDRSRLIQHG